MPISAPFDLAGSLQLGSGIWRVGEFASYTGSTGPILVPKGLIDFGEIDTGDITIDPGSPTQFRSKRSRDFPVRKTLAGESSVTVDLSTFSTTFPILAKFLGGDVVTITQDAGSVADELVMQLSSNAVYHVGQSDSNAYGVRGVDTDSLVLTPAPASPAVWAASAAVTKREVRTKSVSDNILFVALQAGTTGSSEPTWPTTIGGTVTDGTVIWMLVNLDTTVGYVKGTDYDVDESNESGAQFLWNSGNSALAAFAAYDKKALTWQQIQAGKRLQYTGYAEFIGDVEGSESHLQFPQITLQSSGALSTVTDQTTFRQVGLSGSVEKKEGFDLFYWNGKPVAS